MHLNRIAERGAPIATGIIVLLLLILMGLAIFSRPAHAQCGPTYGVWQPMTEVIWQPAPGLTIGFSTGPIYAAPCTPQFFGPPPVIFGRPQYGYRGGYNGAYQQAFDSRLRQLERERQDAIDAAYRAAGRRDADRAWRGNGNVLW